MGAWEERPPHILNFKITWQWPDSCSSSFIFKQTATDTHLIEGWMYPRTCMEVVVKRKVLSLARQKHNSPAHSDSHYWLLSQPNVLHTEHCGQVGNTPASYIGRPRFKSWSTDRLHWGGFLKLFSVPPGKCRDSALKLGHDCFLPNLFQFIIHSSHCHSMLYSPELLKKHH
jgi:hypothetical protein